MNNHSEMILDEYGQKYTIYFKVMEIVLDTLRGFVTEYGILVNTVEARVKDYLSLKEKLERKGYKYNSIMDITDIVGARLVTFYMDDVDKFATKVESTFVIDWENSTDKRKIYNIDQFGYMSLHYICSIPKELYYDPENPEINDIKFEIQLRSILQHAWAAIQHDSGYKSDVEIPKVYIRALSRLAGLLELADDSFCQIRNSIEDYRRRVRQVIKDGSYEDIELNGDSYKAYIENGGFRELNKRIATIDNMEIEEVPLNNFLKIFKSFNFKTLLELDDFVKKYSDLAYEFSVRQFSGKDIDIITSVTGPLNLCIVYILSNNLGEGVVKLLLDKIYGPRKSNERTAARLSNIARSMGLIRSDENVEE